MACYSIIHVPPARHLPLFRGFRRVLAPGGRLMLAFQVGDGHMHLQQAYGHTIKLDAYRLLPPLVTNRLQQAGLTREATLVP